MKLADRTALVTGGGSGIGAATALALALEGARVAIAGRTVAKLREVAARGPLGGEIAQHPVDVADRASVAALFAWAEGALGRIDILVNAAGVNIPNRLMSELTPEEWDRLLAVNATGAYNCIRAVLPAMRERRDGLIVNISSISGVRATLLSGVAYNASKFAMNALATSVSLEEGRNGVRVTTIMPGEVDTPILEFRPKPVSAEHRARILQPEDVAETVVMAACLPPRAHVPELIIKPTSADFF